MLAGHFAATAVRCAANEGPILILQGTTESPRSCPRAWCNWEWDTAFAGKSRTGQLAIAGRLTVGSSLSGAIVSSVM